MPNTTIMITIVTQNYPFLRSVGRILPPFAPVDVAGCDTLLMSNTDAVIVDEVLPKFIKPDDA